jgi:hypothetical protein
MGPGRGGIGNPSIMVASVRLRISLGLDYSTSGACNVSGGQKTTNTRICDRYVICRSFDAGVSNITTLSHFQGMVVQVLSNAIVMSTGLECAIGLN